MKTLRDAISAVREASSDIQRVNASCSEAMMTALISCWRNGAMPMRSERTISDG